MTIRIFRNLSSRLDQHRLETRISLGQDQNCVETRIDSKMELEHFHYVIPTVKLFQRLGNCKFEP